MYTPHGTGSFGLHSRFCMGYFLKVGRVDTVKLPVFVFEDSHVEICSFLHNLNMFRLVFVIKALYRKYLPALQIDSETLGLLYLRQYATKVFSVKPAVAVESCRYQQVVNQCPLYPSVTVNLLFHFRHRLLHALSIFVCVVCNVELNVEGGNVCGFNEEEMVGGFAG